MGFSILHSAQRNIFPRVQKLNSIQNQILKRPFLISYERATETWNTEVICLISKGKSNMPNTNISYGWNQIKGRVATPKQMNFRKSSKRPLTPPPPIFGKLYCGFCDKIATKVRMFIWRNFCVFYDPISHEMHVAQMFNMVIGWKHTIKEIFVYFHGQKALFKGPNFAI